ncbi:MAG: hypothetical protein JXD22_13915 [Sedimentisphaerales bacterium]|nr:hypothetical protein [Sedimentisphaerales bacterium]
MVSRKLIFILTLAFVFTIWSQEFVQAEELYKEAVVIGGYSDRDQWVGEKNPGLKNSIGFEYYEKFSDEYGDFLTLDLQMRAAYDSSEDSSDAFGVEIHNAWLEYKLGLGQSLKIGHFDPAFGLEPVLDTHGTLLQTLAAKNIGFKKDWGIGYKGLLGDFDYQLAAGLGSGMGIRRKDDSYLLTGRISTPQTKDTQVGLSFLYGQTLQSSQSWTIPAPELVSDKSIRKKRIGLDVQCPLGIFDFKAEAAVGDNEGETVAGGLAELGYTVPEQQNLKIKMQTMYWSNDWEEKDARDLTLSPVIEYKVSSTTTVRLGYFHDIYSSSDENKMVVLQLYYYGL